MKQFQDFLNESVEGDIKKFQKKIEPTIRKRVGIDFDYSIKNNTLRIELDDKLFALIKYMDIKGGVSVDKIVTALQNAVKDHKKPISKKRVVHELPHIPGYEISTKGD